MTSFFVAKKEICVLQDEAGIFRWPLRSKLAHSPGNLEQLDDLVKTLTVLSSIGPLL